MHGKKERDELYEKGFHFTVLPFVNRMDRGGLRKERFGDPRKKPGFSKTAFYNVVAIRISPVPFFLP